MDHARPGRRRPSLSQPLVERDQRRRAIDALVRLAYSRSTASLSVKSVCEEARMARDTFYLRFGGMAGLLRVAFPECFRDLFGPLQEVAVSVRGPTDLDLALETFFGAAAKHPDKATLCLVRCHEAAEQARGADVEATVQLWLGLLVGAHLRPRPGGPSTHPSPSQYEYLACMLVSLASRPLQRSRPDQLLDGAPAGSHLIASLLP